jgi:hypothetical protein
LAISASNWRGTCTLISEGAGGSMLSTLCMIVEVCAAPNGLLAGEELVEDDARREEIVRPSRVWPMNCSGDM